LVVPGWNDGDVELRGIARFLAGVSRDIPWHVTAFHPDYKMADRNGTPAATLRRAADIGQSEGLHFVYAGNVPGRTGTLENTYCPACKALLVERMGFRVLANHLGPDSLCPQCRTPIPGVWS
jgi:pyruvate formate lyase activating enzyme